MEIIIFYVKIISTAGFLGGNLNYIILIGVDLYNHWMRDKSSCCDWVTSILIWYPKIAAP
jgi:hypothetical protein